LDTAILKPEMTQEQARQAILEGIELKFYTVCVRLCDIPMAVELCRGWVMQS
jgi:deoxyribose-phosphate aldolase